ncbi:hypothetical protein T492DRAFT_915163, partial [Pavlovales sp. CCMP2436]
MIPRGDSAAMPVKGLTLEARLLRGAASGQLNNATSRRFGPRGDLVKLEKACASLVEAHARFAHAFRKLLGRTARIAPNVSVDERGIYMAWSVSSDQRARMRSVDEPTAREAMPMLNTNP